MKFFIDTANVDEIREANDMGIICGVTTNPSLIAKEGRVFEEVIAEIASIVDGPISGEVKATTTDAEGMIKEAKKGRYPENLVFEVVDAKHLPYKDDSFDVVIIANALHVMFEPEKAVKEIERVLRKDGLLIAPNFVSHNKGIISRIWSNILKLAGIKFEHQWSGKEYIIWLKKNGWKILHNKLLPARISLMYVECIKRADA